MNRRFLDAETAADLGRLDQAAIDRVREEAWPSAENADELHDALMQLGFITVEEGKLNNWQALFDELVGERRATILTMQGVGKPQSAQSSSQRRAEENFSASSAVNLWVPAERLNLLRAIHPAGSLTPQIDPPSTYAAEEWSSENALVEIVRGRLDGLGPITADELANSFSLPANQIDVALAKLEGEGFAMPGTIHTSGYAGVLAR